MPIFARFCRVSSISRSVVATLLFQLLVIGVFSVLSVTPMFAAGGAASFSLQPALYDPANTTTRSYYILNLQPGAITTLGVRVLNTGTAWGSVSLYPVDATTGATGGTVFRMHK